MNEFQQALDWRTRLRDARVARGVTFAELARRTGLSVSALKAYESGRRHPSPTALDEIIAAVGIAHEEGNPIRAGAGFAIDFAALFDQRYVFDLRIAQQQLDRLPWPAYITNQATLVVAFNRPFATLLGVEPEIDFPDPAERNLLAYANQPRFTRCLENFDEVVGMLIGLAKGDRVRRPIRSGHRLGQRTRLRASFRATPLSSAASWICGRTHRRSRIARGTCTRSGGAIEASSRRCVSLLRSHQRTFGTSCGGTSGCQPTQTARGASQESARKGICSPGGIQTRDHRTCT